MTATEAKTKGPVRDRKIPDLSSKAEVAAMLGCSHQYVQRLIEDGRLPALKVGATWVIRTALVEAWEVDQRAAYAPDEKL